MKTLQDFGADYQTRVENALRSLRAGKGVLLVDDENRENEGDIIYSAEKMTVSDMALMIRECSGIVCLCLTPEKSQHLGLHPMVANNSSKNQTAFTISIEAREGVTTGVSAADRLHTIKTAIAPDAQPSDLAHPGHVFPLTAKENGVFERRGHTEGSTDLVKLAGLGDTAVLCELTNEDGTMSKLPEIIRFAQKQDMPVVTIEDIYQYRLHHESIVRRGATAQLPTQFGDFLSTAYISLSDQSEHLALTQGQWDDDEPVLVRIHSSCATGDLFGSYRCDCGPQLHEAMHRIDANGQGVIVYLNQEGRGIGLYNKIHAYKLQEEGLDTVEANLKLGFQPDERDYSVAAAILKNLGVRNIRLMTNNPEKIEAMKSFGFNIVETLSIEITSNPHNDSYLKTKKNKMGHLLKLAD